MNINTFEILPFKDIPKKELKLGKWIELTEKEKLLLDGMNRVQRREWLERNRKFSKGRWGFLK